MKRQIIPEAFVNQRETIDKTLIEAQNQPSQYYTRRNNRRTNVNQFHSGSLSHSSSDSSSNGQALRYGWNQPQAHNQALPLAPSASNMGVMGVDVYGFRNNAANKFGGAGGTGVVHVPQIFDDQPITKPSVSSVSSSGSRNLSDDSVVDAGLGAPSPHAGNGGGLATFDPFNEKDHLWSFNSSNNFLGGNLAPSSSNIWGDNNKTDAAVWG
ncbi:uncharacterized protein CXQ87_003794 [Candidozyma duobushaemuli]|uniref:Uncharacterized protein n=1 Tax=Candidozyma duobushaemuli TaxID=1231522 RepID=A0A2V1AE18_9ASCO|nr:uncharacterized protein CXQ87_003794 [[Candida] duobushaemulonis]PVH15935.1 hypothetical protein CXQ87_003794 [[Candida] duobushaemulonis]